MRSEKNSNDTNVPEDSDCSVFEDISTIFPRLRMSVMRIQFTLYLSLLAKALLPTFYSSVRVSLLGDLPSDSGVRGPMVSMNNVLKGLSYSSIRSSVVRPL